MNKTNSKLGIETVFARPYNARAKVIERFFKEFQEGFEKLLPSYVGSNIQNKPAYMMRNEKLHSALHNNFVPTIEETIKLIDMWLNFKNSQPCPNAPDKTIAEVLSERKRQNIDINTLDDLMLATEVKTIQRNGIRFLNCDYFDERLYGFKNKVLIKYNLFDLTSIKVYTTKGEYLCTAERVTETHPIAKLLGDVKDYEDYKQKIVRQKQLKKKTVNAVKNYFSTEEIKYLETKMDEVISPPVQTSFKESSKAVQTIFKNNSQKYEYLIKHDPSNPRKDNMNKVFIRTNNVKNFIGLVENLLNKPKNIPKMGLVYGEPGLGKTQTALWLVCKYDGIYLRASNLMTGRWLLDGLIKEMDELPRYLTSDNFNLVVKKLKANPKVIFIDEIDYLMNNFKTIEILRDLHDETDCPIIMIGMG